MEEKPFIASNALKRKYKKILDPVTDAFPDVPEGNSIKWDSLWLFELKKTQHLWTSTMSFKVAYNGGDDAIANLQLLCLFSQRVSIYDSRL